MTANCPTCYQEVDDKPVDRCADCDKELQHVFPDHLAGSKQYSGALIIRLSGGYGMFVDNMEGWPGGGQELEIILCRECARAACRALPWMRRAIGGDYSDG